MAEGAPATEDPASGASAGTRRLCRLTRPRSAAERPSGARVRRTRVIRFPYALCFLPPLHRVRSLGGGPVRRSSGETVRTLSTRTPPPFPRSGVRVWLFCLVIAPFRRTALSTAVITPYPTLGCRLARYERGGVRVRSRRGAATVCGTRRDVLPQATQPSPRSGLRTCDTVAEAADTPGVQHSLQAVPAALALTRRAGRSRARGSRMHLPCAG